MRTRKDLSDLQFGDEGSVGARFASGTSEGL